MKPISRILSDVERVVGAESLATACGLDRNNLGDSLFQKLYDDGVADTPALLRWVNDLLGRVAIVGVLEDLRLKFDPNEPTDVLLKKWFAYRGVDDFLQPQARPCELANYLTEMARQVAATPASFDALRLMGAPLTSLMRYTSLFYIRELTRDDSLTLEVLERLSLSELCELLNNEAPLRAKPYDRASKERLTLSGEAARESLARLSALAEMTDEWSQDKSREFSENLLSVLNEWHGEDSRIPKACAVAEIYDTRFSSQVTCRDEIGRKVVLNGVISSLSCGDDVLVRAKDEGNIWAPRPQSVPDSPIWEMPDSMSRENSPSAPARDQVFISYCHRDDKWLKMLRIHLEPYVRSAMIAVWDDTEISPGTLWMDSITRALAAAKVAVLLVSPDFLASHFIAEQELPPLLEAAKRAGVVILWVPVRSSSYEVTPIAEYQAVHPAGRPLASLTPAARDKALVKISELIRREYQR
jgi:hypothetical protein